MVVMSCQTIKYNNIKYMKIFEHCQSILSPVMMFLIVGIHLKWMKYDFLCYSNNQFLHFIKKKLSLLVFVIHIELAE